MRNPKADCFCRKREFGGRRAGQCELTPSDVPFINWNPPNRTTDAELRIDYQRVPARALVCNNLHVVGAVQTSAANMVGQGHHPAVDCPKNARSTGQNPSLGW